MTRKHASLLSDPIPIKSTPKGKEFLLSFISPGIKEVDGYDACKFVARHCANGNSQIQVIGFDQYYSPVAHAESFIINISIAGIHILTTRISDVSNAFQNTNAPINEKFCVSPPPYYLDWFEISYPNVLFNRDEGKFCLQCMNVI